MPTQCFRTLEEFFVDVCSHAGIDDMDACAIYFDNLLRLNLIEVRTQETELEHNSISRHISNSGHGEIDERLIQNRYEALYATPFCEMFIQMCLEDIPAG